VESSTTPLDQTFAQATLPPQATLDPGHPAVISLVIIAKKMEQTVQRQHTQLDLNRVAGLSGLTPRDTARNHDFAKKTGLFGRERQHVCRGILVPVSSVELPDTRIGYECNDDRTPGGSR
jgi:hypothetical protein